MNLMLLDTNFNAVSVIDTYESFIWTDRYNGCGDFELYMPVSSDILSSVKRGYYIESANSEHAMIVESIKINSDSETGNHITITGRSLESILDRRVIWGSMSVSGTVQKCIRSLVDACIINPSKSERKIANFIFETTDDPLINEETINAQYNGNNLLDVITAICKEKNIGFKIVFDANYNFVFKLYRGEDRSYDQSENPYVVFSPSFDNLLNSNYLEEDSSFKNVVLVGGSENDNGERMYSAVGDVEGLARRELYVDASDIQRNSLIVTKDTMQEIITKQSEGMSVKTISEELNLPEVVVQTIIGLVGDLGIDISGELTDEAYTDVTNALGEENESLTQDEYKQMLWQRGNETLTDHKDSTCFEGECETTSTYVYGVDFFIGDIVQIENEYGHQAKARVTEFVISDNTSGSSTYPTFETIK
mgnify:CR=1 FL=1